MIIAAHVPIAVSAIGSETEWWLGEPTTTPENKNAVTINELVHTLQRHSESPDVDSRASSYEYCQGFYLTRFKQT